MPETKYDLSEALHKFSEDIPVQLLRTGPAKYAPLDPEKEGSWKLIHENGRPMAVAWTDWEDGFNVILMSDTPNASRLYDYVTRSKEVDVPAGWAYTTLETFVNRFKDTEIAISGAKDGKLAEVYKLTGGMTGEEDTDGNED